MKHFKVFKTEADFLGQQEKYKYPTICYIKDTKKLDWTFHPELYEFVDLGLPSGLKWAAWNVGATKPEEYGLYFAWGEAQGYTGITDEKKFKWADYKWSADGGSTFTKYTLNDGLTQLDLADDGAIQEDLTHSHISFCRMPTSAECAELTANTTTSWTTDYNGSGVAGKILTSKINGNSIFIPACGYAADGKLNYKGSRSYFWLSTMHLTSAKGAYNLYAHKTFIGIYGYTRNDGLPIRPVKK